MGIDSIETAIMGHADYGETISAIVSHPGWAWSEQWWRVGCVVCSADNGETWEQKSNRPTVPINIDRLGCSGHNPDMSLDWVGWDLDVGHGGVCYDNVGEAIKDAYRLREALDEAEIRLSTSGNGVHVRHLLPEDSGLSSRQAGQIARHVAVTLDIRADPSSMGRQVHWLWSRRPKSTSFQLVEAQTKPVLDLPEIAVEALSAANRDGNPAQWSGSSSYDPTSADEANEDLAVANWEPCSFVDRTPLGNRNWADIRHFANDYNVPIPRAIELIRRRGANVHPDARQWERMLRYVRYPQGWACRRHARASGVGFGNRQWGAQR